MTSTTESDTGSRVTGAASSPTNQPVAAHAVSDNANDPGANHSPGNSPRAVRTRNLRMMRLLERIAAKFSEAGVPLLVLKGAALNLTLYERPDDRPMVDLDLMVRPEDIDQAFSLLEKLGGLRGEPLVRDDFFPRFHYEMEYTVGAIYPIKIDLHVRPFRPLRYARLVPADALWDRAEMVSIGRASVLAPSADDMLVHLAVHGVVHGFADRKWLVDIKRTVDTHGDELNWERFLTTVEHWRLVLPVRRALQRVEGEFGRTFPPTVLQQLWKMRISWRDRLALWQAPRDAEHPATHVVVNVLCTPGWRFALGYLLAVLIPGRAHMADWYCGRHWGWLPCAHLLRCFGPITRRFPRFWTWFAKIETAKSPTHGIGVFATRDIKAGDVVARYHGKAVERCGMYVVSHKSPSGEKRRYELTGKLKHLNHSCHPNAELSGFQLVALRPIRSGQEIKIDYGEGTCDCKTMQRSESVSSPEGAADAGRAIRGRKRSPRHPAGRSWKNKIGTRGGAESSLAMRRAFLGSVGKKAAYLTPLVLTLAASPAFASGISCGSIGTACTSDAECCTTVCHPTMDTCTCKGVASTCTTDIECCSNNCSSGMCAN